MIDFRLIGYTNGILLLVLSMISLLIGSVEVLTPQLLYGEEFFAAGGASAFFGGLLYLTNRGSDFDNITVHTAYFLTVSCWVMVGLFSTLPLYFGNLGLSFTDAAFEAFSALTTTGSTVLTGLDSMSAGILLWRSMLQWLGGIGIVVMALAIFPLLRVGGMNLFQSESSQVSEKLTPRLAHFVKMTVLVYVLLTLLCTFLMYVAGMTLFDALNHAMTTLSTGGFSTHDGSIGFFNSVPIEMITIVFMIIGSLPLIMYADFLFISQRKFTFRRYSQVGWLLAFLAVTVVAMAVWNWQTMAMTFAHAFRLSAFNITSILTDTGFATSDFSSWGSLAIGVFFFLYFVGGCAGSTSGAIKIFRWQLLFAGLQAQFRKNLSPSRICNVTYEGHLVDEQILHGVRNFLFLYIMTFVTLSLLLMLFNLDFLTSISGVAQAMANAGPGLGVSNGPAGNFSSFPAGGKWLLCLAMLLGRLELFTVFALLLPSYWKA